MTDRRAGKNNAKSKTNTANQKKILLAKERVLRIKKDILKIVEDMLEKHISEEWFLKHCVKLCHADYDDVIQERSIEYLCGYPLCPNTLKLDRRQKYHISQATNKVYDLTERKCFCSNQCYKASNYLKAQLSPVPLYMRKEEEIKIHLLSDVNNRGSVGEEIVFHHKISEEELNNVYSDEKVPNHFSNILQQDTRKCTELFKNLEIKEHTFENPYVLDKKNISDSSEIPPVNDDVSTESEFIDSDDNDNEKLFPVYDNLLVLSEKHMPVPKSVKKAVLISPLTPNQTKNSAAEELPLQFVQRIIQNWFTEDSMKYLLGDQQVYASKADLLLKSMTATDSICSDRLASIKNEYINLCLKIDKLPDDDDDLYARNDADFVCTADSNKAKSLLDPKQKFKRRPKRNFDGDKSKNVTSDSKQLDNEDKVEKKENKVDMGSNSSMKDKSVVKNASFSNSCELLNGEKSLKVNENPALPGTSVQGAQLEISTGDEVEPEPNLPLVDSVAQNALRKQVLTGQLKSVYINMLPIIGLHYTDIRNGLRQLIDTFSLTPENIMYRPKEWKLISIVLLRVLTKSVLKEIHLNEEHFSNLCMHPMVKVKVSVQEIEELVLFILSEENLRKMHSYST